MKPIQAKNIGIVIQGPTIYYKEIVASYSGKENIVWSTWDDEPAQHLEYIRAHQFPLFLQSKVGVEPGKNNVNLQCLSVYGGIQFLKKNPLITHIVKIRADFIVEALEAFLQQCINCFALNDMCYMGYVWYYHRMMHRRYYLTDFINGGLIASMEKFWKPSFLPMNGSPNPEKWLENRYYASEDFLEKNYKKLVRKHAFIAFKNFHIISLKLNIDFLSRIKVDGVYRDQPSIMDICKHIFFLARLVMKKVLYRKN